MSKSVLIQVFEVSFHLFDFFCPGILHGVHWGLGHGCGELIGGFMISGIGARKTFAIFGILSLVDLLFFVLVNILHDNCCPEEETETPNDYEYQHLAEKPCCQN